MKTVRVVAAIIKANNEKRRTCYFCNPTGIWRIERFMGVSGGKIEEGETPQEALKREILEELDTEIAIGELVETIEYDYPTFHLSMDCFWCEVIKGDLVLKEHQAARWLDQNSLNEVEWLPADIALIDRLQNRDGLR